MNFLTRYLAIINCHRRTLPLIWRRTKLQLLSLCISIFYWNIHENGFLSNRATIIENVYYEIYLDRLYPAQIVYSSFMTPQKNNLSLFGSNWIYKPDQTMFSSIYKFFPFIKTTSSTLNFFIITIWVTAASCAVFILRYRPHKLRIQFVSGKVLKTF